MKLFFRKIAEFLDTLIDSDYDLSYEIEDRCLSVLIDEFSRINIFYQGDSNPEFLYCINSKKELKFQKNADDVIRIIESKLGDEITHSAPILK